MHVKETSHRLIEVLKKFLSDLSLQRQSLMTVEEQQVRAIGLTREDLASAIARLQQSQAQAVAAVAALSEQIAYLKFAVKGDNADTAVYLQSTSELEIDLQESQDIFAADQEQREEELAALRQVLETTTGNGMQDMYPGSASLCRAIVGASVAANDRCLEEQVESKNMGNAEMDGRTIKKFRKVDRSEVVSTHAINKNVLCVRLWKGTCCRRILSFFPSFFLSFLSFFLFLKKDVSKKKRCFRGAHGGPGREK